MSEKVTGKERDLKLELKMRIEPIGYRNFLVGGMRDYESSMIRKSESQKLIRCY